MKLIKKSIIIVSGLIMCASTLSSISRMRSLPLIFNTKKPALFQGASFTTSQTSRNAQTPHIYTTQKKPSLSLIARISLFLTSKLNGTSFEENVIKWEISEYHKKQLQAASQSSASQDSLETCIALGTTTIRQNPVKFIYKNGELELKETTSEACSPKKTYAKIQKENQNFHDYSFGAIKQNIPFFPRITIRAVCITPLTNTSFLNNNSEEITKCIETRTKAS